jgi:hypothetical protein
MDSMADTAEIRGARLHFTRLAWRASYTAPAENGHIAALVAALPLERSERFRTKREIDVGAGFANIGGKQGPFGR